MENNVINEKIANEQLNEVSGGKLTAKEYTEKNLIGSFGRKITIDEAKSYIGSRVIFRVDGKFFMGVLKKYYTKQVTVDDFVGNYKSVDLDVDGMGPWTLSVGDTLSSSNFEDLWLYQP